MRPEGFEPPTPTFVALYSIQMNYGRKLGLIVYCTIRKAGVCRLHTTYPIVPRMQGGIEFESLRRVYRRFIQDLPAA